ncbi:MAG: methylated-DNA--[protein]-cysteine S-methyltransferase [Spirochaetes bacterium]|nr:methylated-DNA--[protein]-cysteine S-methyltransferase [Spirochaetota bacterium]
MQLKYLLSFPDIRYCAYPFPTGRLYIFGNQKSIKMILFGNELDHKNDVEKNFMEGVSGAINKAIKFFDCYLTGKECPHPELDMLPFTANEKKIYKSLQKVGFGKTITYGVLAKKSGMPGASRFVGNAMAKNFFPLIIPCHRVVKYGGGIGGFSSGKGTKNFLLQHEKVFCK